MSLATIFLLFIITIHHSHSLSPSETQALVDIRASLRGLPGSTFFSTWNFSTKTRDPCSSFSGIACSLDPADSTLKVSVLTLGTGLESSPGLTGRLPPSIANLTALTELVVYPGRISGPIPPEIGLRRRRLRLVSISSNLISGPIPASFATLTELHTLDFSHNQLTGPIPISLFSSSSSLPNLRVLVLASNKLSGVLPSSVSSASLLHLDLRANLLFGLLPPLPASLQYLSLADNSFSGPINAAFSSTPTNLTYIDLSMNKFTGKIPTPIFSLPELSTILLQRNSFEGPLIMPESGTVSWQLVDLSHNVIGGEVPARLAAAESLFLNSNRLVGPVPREFVESVYAGNMTTFYAQHNFLTAFPSPESVPLPQSVSLCLVYNCMEVTESAEAGCPASAGTKQARPREQCPSDG